MFFVDEWMNYFKLSCMRKINLLLFAFSILLFACSINKQIGKLAKTDILNDSNFAPAHVGISLYDANEKKYIYNYQGDKYFVPASNTKLLTCYAAMKYLGDSLVGLRYEYNDSGISIVGNGDPTFLHSDFKNQRVYDFLNQPIKYTYINDGVLDQFSPLGNGWAWNDYDADYMPERSQFPIYGNVVKFYLDHDTLAVSPPYFTHDNSFKWLNNGIKNGTGLHFRIYRHPALNSFISISNPSITSNFKTQIIPFKTGGYIKYKDEQQNVFFIIILEDTLHKKINQGFSNYPRSIFKNVIHSQPTDSLLKITMHRSDNFFAEQTLLMVSNEKLGLMSDAKIIDTLLKTDYKEMPQKPKWVDGSGLSRYNLISPQDFVFVLEKMKNEFDWKRITTILPTGNDGTLSGYYKNYAGKIYAKTGTLSNNVSLSGYLITNKGKQLIFSVQVNNHQTSASAIRKAVEKFLTSVIDKY